MGLALVAVVPYFWQLILGRGYNVVNDGITYVMCGEWLQTHGFFELAEPYPHQPIGAEILVFQKHGLRMGANFLLALVQSLSIHWHALELYPAIVTHGVLLNLFGVYLCIRWGLRRSRFLAVLGVCLAGLLANPLHFSAVAGFMNQLYGTAFLCCGLAVLARALPRINHGWRMACLLGLIHGALLSFYSELLPFLLVADLCFALACIVRARRQRRLGSVLAYGGLIAGFCLVFGNVEFFRVWQAVHLMLSIAGVGWHIPLTPRFPAFLSGSGDFSGIDPNSATRGVHAHFLVIGVVLGLLLVLGLFSAWRRRAAVSLLGAAGGFLAVALLYAFWSRDPWTGEVGHTWNLFKLGKYAYPLVVVFQVQGLWLLCRDRRRIQVVLVVLVVGLALFHWPEHHRAARLHAKVFRSIVGSNDPAHDLHRLRARVARLNPDHIVFGTSNPPRLTMLLYAVFPRSVANRWPDNWRTWLVDTPSLEFRPTGSCLLIDCDVANPRHPFGATFLDQDRLAIIHTANVIPMHRARKERSSWVGNKPLVFEVFSPTAGPAVLTFEALPGPALPDTSSRTVRITEPGGKVRDMVLDVTQGTTVRVPVRLPVGFCQVKLECLDEPTPSSDRDSRQLLGVVGPSFKPLTPALARKNAAER
jgi:hypothetical protein